MFAGQVGEQHDPIRGPGAGFLNYLFRRIGHHVGSLACPSVGAVERDQTIGNVIRELIARGFPD
jgi:hypothetical protein